MTLNLLNSPFSEVQTKLINELYPTLTDYQKIWLTGYLSAVQSHGTTFDALQVTVSEQEHATTSVLSIVKQEATILYGSQTGNAQSVAEKLKAALDAQSIETTISSMSAFKPNNLKKLTNLFVVTSTHGEGEPPDNAISLHNFIYSKRAPKLDDVSFSVLALGDSSYEFFCKTGIDFDEQLEKLGAKRIVPRVDCDLDYDDQVAEWITQVVASLAAASPNAPTAQQPVASAVEVGASAYNKNNPFYAEVLESINLNGRGSNKHTRHLELSLEGSGLTYEPGDSLGIIPENDENLVTALVLSLGFDGSEKVTLNEGKFELADALRTKLDITALSKPLLQKLAPFTNNEEYAALLVDDEKLKQFIYGRDLLDVVQSYGPFTLTAQQFVEQLRKIPVRLYSIASSQKANEEEVHVTIGKVFYELDGRERLGVASGQVAERLEIGDKIPVYIHKNPNFRLPENPDTPIIMIGAGTGIAPYRAFLEERAEQGIDGKAWLFFGDQHFVTDFLYQTELQRYLADGTLTNLSVAFSRDTEQKVYVQHRLLENAEQVYEWVEEGAVIYICGDKKRMAHDVNETLIQIIEQQGGKSAEEAKTYLEQLTQQNRYQRDVY